MSKDYSWPLPDGFPPGSRVIIKGIPTLDTTYPIFGINFLTNLPEKDKEVDIAYHTAIRYGAGYVVNNSFLVGKGWQEEERHQDLCIIAGKPFKIMIVCEATHFILYINGNHFSDFRHRMPVERIQCLAIVASVKVTSVSVDRIKSISWPLPNGFQVNDTVIIRGTAGTQDNSEQFEVNFQAFSPSDKPGDIPFSMTAQFNEGILVNNTYKSNAWGTKEIYENLPIQRGKDFEIVIGNRATQFKVFVNEEEFCTYNIRIPNKAITHLVIRDNVHVSSITVTSAKIDPRTSNYD